MKKHLFSLSVGIIISVLALYFAFKNVPLKDLAIFIGKGLVNLCIVLILGGIFIVVDVTRNLLIKGILALPRVFWFISLKTQNRFRNIIKNRLVTIFENIAGGFGLLKKSAVWRLVLV